MTGYRCCFLLWLSCVCIGLVVGCDRKERCDDAAVARMVQNLPVRPAGGHAMLYTSVSQTCNEIAKLKDASSKPGQYKALAARLTDIDFAEKRRREFPTLVPTPDGLVKCWDNGEMKKAEHR